MTSLSLSLSLSHHRVSPFSRMRTTCRRPASTSRLMIVVESTEIPIPT